jgi:hypothetical protein
MKKYYIIRLILDKKTKYIIWFSNTHNGVVTENNRIVSFSDIQSVFDYSNVNSIEVETLDVFEYNLEYVSGWILKPLSSTLDVKKILDTWNLLDDVAKSIKQDLKDQDPFTKGIYNKIFLSNANLASLIGTTPYQSDWRDKEMQRLAVILYRGLNLLRRHLVPNQ